MGEKISLRELEERDANFIFRTKHIIGSTQTISSGKSISLEEVIEWIKNSKKQQEIKYWAVCSDDCFQNIVGWTCLKVNNKGICAEFGGATICASRFNNAKIYYDTYCKVMEKAFDSLHVSEVICVNTSNSRFHQAFNAIFFNHTSLTKPQFEEMRSKEEIFFRQLEQAVGNEYEDNEGIDAFLSLVKNNLEPSKLEPINPNTRFRELEEWSSLYAIEFVSIIEANYNARLDASDLSDCYTFSDLFSVISQKSLETKLSAIEPIECESFS